MLWFAQASVGLAGFLGKILVALKKIFSSTIFPDFRYIYVPVPGLRTVGLCYTYFGIHARYVRCFLKKLEFVNNSPPSTHMYAVCNLCIVI